MDQGHRTNPAELLHLCPRVCLFDASYVVLHGAYHHDSQVCRQFIFVSYLEQRIPGQRWVVAHGFGGHPFDYTAAVTALQNSREPFQILAMCLCIFLQ